MFTRRNVPLCRNVPLTVKSLVEQPKTKLMPRWLMGRKVFIQIQWNLSSAAPLFRGHKLWTRKKKLPSQLLKLRYDCDGHIFISFVFSQLTSFHSVFHFFRGFMTSINWPASTVWVFIARLVEHCSANAEATGSNLVEAPKTFLTGT